MATNFTDKKIEEGLGGSFQDRVRALDALGEAPQTKRRSTAHQRPEEEEQYEEAPTQKRRHRKGLTGVLNGELLRSKSLMRQIPLGILIIVYLALLITNRYRVEDLAKERIELKERINFLREHKIQMQKQYQESITISTIAKQLDSTGVGIIGGPPYEIKVDKR